MTDASRNAQTFPVNVSYEEKLNISHGYKDTKLHVSNDNFKRIIDAIQVGKKPQTIDHLQLPSCGNKQQIDDGSNHAYSCDSKKLPGLVLAVVGDSESFVPKPWNTLAFTSGLMETVKGAKQCWIVYRGKQDGISELIQNTFKDDLGENQNDKAEKTSLIALQPLTEQIQKVAENQINEWLFLLEPKCTAHKDNQEEYKCYNKFLAQFLSHLSKRYTTLLSIKPDQPDKPGNHDKHTQSEDTVLLKMQVPVLLVVAEGDIATIHQVKSAVSNNVPVLLVKGSGKASNFIAEYLNTSEKKKMLIAKAPLLLGIYIRRDVFAKLEKTMAKIEKYHYLITVFDVDNTDNAKMEDAVVEAIIKGWSLQELTDTVIITESRERPVLKTITSNNVVKVVNVDEKDRSSSDLTKPDVVKPESSNNNLDQESRKTITSNVVDVVDAKDKEIPLMKTFQFTLTPGSLSLYFYIAYQYIQEQITDKTERSKELQLLLLEALIADRVDYASAILQSGVKFNREHVETLYDETLVCHDCNGKDCRNIHAIHIRVCKESGRNIWCTCKSDCKMEKRQPDKCQVCKESDKTISRTCKSDCKMGKHGKSCNSIAPVKEEEVIESCMCIRHNSKDKRVYSFTEANYLCQELLNYPKLEKENKTAKGCQYRCSFCENTTAQVKKENKTAEVSEEEHNEKNKESTFHDLLAWALFANRKELAGVFWTKCSNQLLTAVMASSILKNMAENVEAAKDLKLHDELLQHSKLFEDRILEMQTTLYEEKENECMSLMMAEDNIWGIEVSPVACAYDNKLMDVIGHSCVQRKLNKNWYNDSAVKWTEWMKSMCGCNGVRRNFGKAWRAPIAMFAFHYMFVMAVLFVFSAFILTDIQHLSSVKSIGVYEWLLYIWLLGDVVEEVLRNIVLAFKNEQSGHKLYRLKNYVSNIWNWMTVLCYIMIGGGIVVRIVNSPANTRMLIRFYSFGLFLLYMRFLQSMLVIHYFGPKIIMILKMNVSLNTDYKDAGRHEKDRDNTTLKLNQEPMNLCSKNQISHLYQVCGTGVVIENEWLRLEHMIRPQHVDARMLNKCTFKLKELVNIGWLLLIFIACTGVLYHANMYPSHYDMWSPHGPIYWRIWKIISLPYWQIYGELFLEEIQGDNNSNGTCTFVREEWESNPDIERCVEYDWSLMIIAAFYMLITNLLLVNLVIALFTYRFEEVQQNSDRFWKYTRYSIITDYDTRFPVPFNLVIRIPYLIYVMRWGKTGTNAKNESLDVHVENNLTNGAYNNERSILYPCEKHFATLVFYLYQLNRRGKRTMTI